MPSIPTRSPWDFTDALELLHGSTSSGQDELPLEAKDAPGVQSKSSTKRGAGLGDFSKIWKVLGTTVDAADTQGHISGFTLKPLPNPLVVVKDYTVPNPNRPPAPPLRDDTYASDGGFNSGRKNVTWKEEPEYMEATDVPTTPTSEEGGPSKDLSSPIGNGAVADGQDATPSKKQNKKEKKKKQKLKKLHAQHEQVNTRSRKVVSDIESESEIRKLVKPTPAARASKHLLPPSQVALAESSKLGQSLQSQTEDNSQASGATADSSNNEQTTKRKRVRSKNASFSGSIPSTLVRTASSALDVFGGNLLPTSIMQRDRTTPAQESSQSLQSKLATNAPPHGQEFTTPTHTPAKQVYPFITRQWSVESSTQYLFTNCAPLVVESTTQQKYFSGQLYHNVPMRPRYMLTQYHTNSLGTAQPTQHFQSYNCSLTPPPSRSFQIFEKEDRDLHLLLRLIHDFSEDKKWLTRPVPMADHNTSPTGIHVFIDFSNIWIGFMDHLKSLQLQMHQRIPHQNMSFDALVLLLERKRPVTKRVLAGSYPLMPAMELAKQIGYETLILEKVYKSREPTERQRRILALQSRNSFAALGTQGVPQTPPSNTAAAASFTPSIYSPTSASFALAPMPAPEKWVEQGVDEILHLKILESIVDSDVPSRMVVATGDAAKAEYSEGFMKMIVRALKKGWCVELVAFSKSISSEYTNARFLNEWQGQFRIIMLDVWAQYLLDT